MARGPFVPERDVLFQHELFPHRPDIALREKLLGALGGGIEQTDGIYLVPEKFEAERVGHERREDIQDAAASGEFTLFADRLISNVTGLAKIADDLVHGLVLSDLQMPSKLPEPGGARKSRNQRVKSGHHEPCLEVEESGQACGTSFTEGRVRRQSAIGVRLEPGDHDDRIPSICKKF